MDIKLTKDDAIMILGFIEESTELLENIEERILDLETSFNIETVNDIFRAIHTIKGTSSFLSLTPIKNLSHELEFLLDELRKEKRELTQDIVDILLKGSDCLRNLILSVRDQIEEIKDDTVIKLNDNLEIMSDIKNLLDNKQAVTSKEEKSIENKKEDKPKLNKVNFSELKNADISEDMVSQYNEEGREHLQNIESNLLKLEENPDDEESINEIFRSLHSLKGNSGLILSLIKEDTYEYHVLYNLKETSHKGESLLQKIRDGKFRISAEIITILFKTLDYINLLFDRFKNRFKRKDFESNENIIKLLLKEDFSDIKQEEIANTNKSSENISEYNAEMEGFSQFLEVSKKIIKEWEENKEFKDSDLDILKRVINLLKISSDQFNDNNLNDNIIKLEETIDLLSKKRLDLKDGLVIEIFKDKIKYIEDFKKDKFEREKEETNKINKIGEILLEEGKIEKKDLEEALKIQKKQQIKSMSEKSTDDRQLHNLNIETIRVRMDKLDKLMNDIGELAISKNSFYHIYNKLIQANVNEIAKEFKEKMIMKIGRLAEELQNTIVQVRMIPVKTVFQKFPRMVRDLSLKNNKKIKLVMEGENTELDKTVIEKLNDPLVHIIRNSCDHGIETPEERIKNNKQETGTIILKAEKKGNNVIIMIIDDGRGIDAEKVKKKAIEKNLIDEKEIEKMSDKEIVNLIFMPGFSTAEKVTDVSGRGVGMDVVKTNISKLKGSIEIETEKNIGTTIIIKLPLTLAITKGLSFKLGEENYIVPLESVEEIIKIKKDDIKFFKNRKIINIRNEIIEILDLKNTYNIKDNSENYLNDDEFNVIILKDIGIKFGLIVDKLEDELDMVVKPLPNYLSDLPGIGGSTILGNGSIAIVLDTHELLNMLNS